MAFFRCRAFVGCMALRTGVWLLALIAMLVSGAGSAGSWLEVYWTIYHPIGLRDKAALIIQGGVLSFLFLMTFLGFIAGLKGARGAVYIYAKFVFIHTPFILLALAFVLYTALRPDTSNPNAVEDCLNGSQNPLFVQFCHHSLTSTVRILPVALLGVAALVQFYAWIVSISFGEGKDMDALDRFSSRKYYGSDSDLESNSLPLHPEPPFSLRR
ncbi:hypothetical protein B0H16DRAFT_86996 [Mycena metata]|uniref:Uncharacterized protein n=1 Tax=Mycena metata TaxID=1033252 RepID=A0AAD7NUF6_9AGAR|nr:hypothetical protein B0H16DRAFT_86996 [Mycena metata]